MSSDPDLNASVLRYLDADMVLPPPVRAYLTTIALRHDYRSKARTFCLCGDEYPCRELLWLSHALGVEEGVETPPVPRKLREETSFVLGDSRQ